MATKLSWRSGAVDRRRARAAAPAKAASRGASLSEHFAEIVLAVLLATSCLAIIVFAPDHWRPELLWLFPALGFGLVFGAFPALFMRRRNDILKADAIERDELVGLLLKDYAADRGDWLWSTDTEGRLRGVSAKFAVQVGREISDLEGSPLIDLLSGNAGANRVNVTEITVAMRQKKSFFDIEFATSGKEDANWWRLAGKPVFRDGRYVGYIGTASDITAELKSKEDVNFLAFNDGLTGLANRSHFNQRLAESVSRYARYRTAFAVLYLDLDKFKAVNDTRGHSTGDEVLVEVGRRLKSQLRETDIVARLGGDEFSIILPDAADAAGVSSLAQRLIGAIERPFEIDGDSLMIGLSIGIAMAPANGTQAEQILHNADLALYRSKGGGGNRYSFFESDMDAEIRERRLLEKEIAQGISRNEFVLYYQPLVSTTDNLVTGFEALIRWKHPRRGLLLPEEFLAVAERSTLICTLGAWSIEEACRMLARLPERFSVAVNVSAKHFRTTEIVATVRDALEKNGVPANRLGIEIREDLIIGDPDGTARKLAELVASGLSVTLDNFGTGVSSLSHLLDFPGTQVKIDRSFVSGQGIDPKREATLRTLVELGRSRGLCVCAQGVETAEQAQMLSQAGCGLLQGFHFTEPMPEASIAAQVPLAIKQDIKADGEISVAAA